MHTRRRMARLDMPSPAVSGRHAKGRRRTDPAPGTAHRILVVALLTGSLAASSAVLSGHTVTHDLKSAEYILNTPWMY